jgi:hypothetical protein
MVPDLHGLVWSTCVTSFSLKKKKFLALLAAVEADFMPFRSGSEVKRLCLVSWRRMGRNRGMTWQYLKS